MYRESGCWCRETELVLTEGRLKTPHLSTDGLSSRPVTPDMQLPPLLLSLSLISKKLINFPGRLPMSYLCGLYYGVNKVKITTITTINNITITTITIKTTTFNTITIITIRTVSCPVIIYWPHGGSSGS